MSRQSSLGYSEISNTIKETFDTIEGYTYISTNNDTENAELNGNISVYKDLRDKLNKDPKYDFNGNTLLFSDEKYLISTQIKKDNEMLITSEDNLKTASYVAAAAMFVFAIILIGMKK
jgi:hypothetical protein